MCRGMLWCYVLALTLVDISPHTKLTAHGKSHDVTLHDTLIEGLNFQEWGGEGLAEAGGAGSAVLEGVALQPMALHFGSAALAAPHVRSVTLTNTGNATLHLASVAGTTPDFHASFFESKTLAPQTNTTFSVVYLGRRAGPVTAHLYIHTSLGVYKYPVSAVGVASEYEVWPLVGVRVPANASVEPVLSLHNPTDHVIQVTEVYSSGSWVGLQLPAGGASAPRDAWAVPPHATRDIVRLRLAPPATDVDDSDTQRPLTAYVRVKANVPGGALVVCVEARATPAGEHAAPLHLHMRARGSDDPALTVRLRAANSARSGVRLEAAVRGARCVPEPHAPPDPCEPPHAHAHNGGAAEGAAGARLALLRADLPPLHDFTDVADLTLNYGELWASAEGAEGAEGAVGAVRCAGCVRLGRAALPYSLRLVPGTLRLDPDAMHFVRAGGGGGGGALRAVSLRAHNTSPLPLHVAEVALSADAAPYFRMTEAGPRVVGAGRSAALARLQLLPAALRDNVTLAGALTLRTNLSHYRVPLLVYGGRFVLEWEWPWGGEVAGAVSLGALGTSASRRVGVRLRNPGPAPLCARDLAAELSAGSVQFTLAACPAAPPDHPCRCVEGGAWTQAWLVVVAPARAGELRGHVRVRSQHASTDAALSLRALPGRLHAPPLRLPDAAPFAWSAGELVLESTMELEMFVSEVTQPTVDPALSYIAPAGGRAAVRGGRQVVGGVRYAPELSCHPDCYTGLDFDSPEGRAWLSRLAACGAAGEAALAQDAALAARRLAVFLRLQRHRPAPTNLTLHLHTTEMMQIPVTGSVRLHWPRVSAGAGGSGGATGVLAAVGATRSLRVSAHNPSGSHSLLLQPVLAGDLRLSAMAGGEERCGNGSCVWAPHAFRLAGWRAVRGEVSEWAPVGEGEGAECRAAPTLLLAPHAQIDLTLTFAPQQAALLAAYLYLRNNLTIVEGVLVTAEGAYPSFELAGRKPGSSAPILLEVSECGETSGAGVGVGVGVGVRRSVVVRNTGRVPVRLREWRLAGRPCQARGFRLQPCAPLALAPNDSRTLHLAFAPDFTLARVAARLQLRSELGRAEFTLQANVPARLLPRCAAALPRPPFEPALRLAAALAAFAALVLVLGAAAFDAERLLRRARASRTSPLPRAPLDLRVAPPVPHRPAPAAPAPRSAPPPGRRRRPPRRPLPPLDPLAERRAFERWRAEVLRRADDEESRSSEDTDSVCVEAEAPPAKCTEDVAPPPDEEPCASRPDTPPGLEEYAPDPEPDDDEDRPSNSADEECISTGSEESSPASVEPEERSEPEESEAPADRDSPVRVARPPAAPLGDPTDTGADVSPRLSRARRQSGDAGRRLERPRPSGDAAPAHMKIVKQHSRKEKSVKRRAERPSAPPSRNSPAPLEVEVAGVGAGGAGGAAPAVRWGASWSSVVAARALAPIGSDVRRRAPSADNSLFYFNGAASAPRPDMGWRAPAIERPYPPPSRDYLGDTTGVGSVGSVGAVGSVGSVGAMGSVGAVGSVLGSAYSPLETGGGWGGAWAWGAAGAVRPPPGFSAPPRPPRAYDPFRSLASIWAPGAADWRYEPADTPPAAPTAPADTEER
ncbi:transmembrane protein 131 homolog [Papilio machaon]|uniref:transmembrane protein 131 homolog n=1 Tax=Papilio machaon TaxID=76193 RepID=UPI001E665BBA|nr:transmembrane protein 131 homolog [Papilio machaon]